MKRYLTALLVLIVTVHFCGAIKSVKANDNIHIPKNTCLSYINNVAVKATIASGTEKDITWTIDSNGVLTLSGKGDMPDSAYYIGYSPWYDYKSSIKTVIIEEGIDSIYYYNFYNHENLESISIPSTVSYIDVNAFYDCPRLQAITVDSDNATYCSLNGVLYNRDMSKLIFVPAGITGHLTIPSSVNSIGFDAFYQAANLTSIFIPGSIATIPAYELSKCVKITDITVGNGTTILGSRCFSSMQQLKNVTLPASVNTIEDAVFTGCPRLETINVNQQSNHFSSKDGILFTKDGSELLCYPAGKNITEYTVPSTVETIKSQAFSDCQYLKTVIISEGTTTIEKEAFYYNKKLTHLTIPASVTIIGESAFYESNNISNIHVVTNSVADKYIRRISLSYATITMPAYEYVYDGQAKKPEPIVMINGEKLSVSDYSLQYSNNVNCGQATIKCVGRGEYIGSKSITFEIVGKNIADCNVVLSTSNFTYNGKAHCPDVVVMSDDGFLTEGTDYTLLYKNNIYAGKGTVEVNGIGVYSGTASSSFEINKASPKITVDNKSIVIKKKANISAKTTGESVLKYKSSDKSKGTISSKGVVTAKAYGKLSITITSPESSNYCQITKKITVKVVPKKATFISVQSKKKKQVTLKWKKDKTVTGYQLGFSTTVDRSILNQKTIKNAKTTSVSTSGFSSGKKYYFWIRSYKTIKGTKYYGPWSNIKSIKVK